MILQSEVFLAENDFLGVKCTPRVLKFQDRNDPTLVEMRVQTTADDVPMPKYGIFLYFLPFQPVLS